MIGKALFVIEKTDCGPRGFEVDIHILSGYYDYLQDELSDFTYEMAYLPGPVEKMKIGDKIWVKVSWTIRHTRDYFGEYDSDLWYNTVRVIKRRKAKQRRKDY